MTDYGVHKAHCFMIVQPENEFMGCKYGRDEDCPMYVERPNPENSVTRFEVIDHRDGSPTFGRAFVSHGVKIELSYQDDGKTLKVFVS